jgi:uncharacterized protein (TIGR00375 family)
MLVNADLHIHGRYSIGVSKNMTPVVLARESKRKGIGLLGTGDCLHPKWFDEFKELTKVDEGTFELGGTRFVPTTEVEDSSRVHHLLIFPSMDSVLGFREKVANHSSNVDTSGRPNIRLSGEEIGQHALDADALFGPSHAFTPWTSMYAYNDTLEDAYGDLAMHVSFIELGLSADSEYADSIAELRDRTFLTNSDAHSPYPLRLAREFNRFDLEEVTYEHLREAIQRPGPGRIVLNVGLPPQEGKYNKTACTRCYTHYSLTEAKARKWRCQCRGLIKKGVRDRVGELADSDGKRHPEHRPNYIHLIPLTEIIMRALNIKTHSSKKVSGEWDRLVEEFGSEVTVLVDTRIDEITEVSNENISNAILAFREGRIVVRPGGGGKYGRVLVPGFDDIDETSLDQNGIRGRRIQKGLGDF